MATGRAKLCVGVMAATLALTGCGGDDDAPVEAGASGAQGASGAEAAASDITAEEFLAKLLPEKELAVEGVVASEPECEGVEVEPSLILVLSDAAARTNPETPLTDLVTAEC